jgi:hypothetical protein
MRHTKLWHGAAFATCLLAVACDLEHATDIVHGLSPGSSPPVGGPPPPAAVDAGPDGALPPGCHCSRRPGPTLSFRCARGAGASVSGVVGPAGGTLVLEGEQGRASGVPLRLEIPPGALADATLITITELAEPPPVGPVDYSPVYEFAPVSLVLAQPARLQVPWCNVDGEVRTSTFWSVGGSAAFQALADDYQNAGFNQASITHFGRGFVADTTASDPPACQAGSVD